VIISAVLDPPAQKRAFDILPGSYPAMRPAVWCLFALVGFSCHPAGRLHDPSLPGRCGRVTIFRRSQAKDFRTLLVGRACRSEQRGLVYNLVNGDEIA